MDKEVPASGWKNALRWIAVLPAAVVAAVVAGLLMGLVSWLGSSRFGDDSWFSYILNNTLMAGAQGAGFVWFGAVIAPSRKAITAIVLTALVIFLSGTGFFLLLGREQWMELWKLISTVAGATITAQIVRKEYP